MTTRPKKVQTPTPVPIDRLLTVREVAELSSCSAETIRRALHTTNPRHFPPPLIMAGRKGRYGAFLIRQSEAARWIDSLIHFAYDGGYS